MAHERNNQEFYNRVDALCLRLRDVGMTSEANRISRLLHRVAWTSTSELFDALESALEDVLSGPDARKLTPRVVQELTYCREVLANT